MEFQMADTLTYNIIATTTLGANAGSVTFSSIPGTYTDLVLVSNVATTSSTNFGYYLNNDSANNYCVVNMYGNGSSTSSANSTTEGALWANWSNYTSTTVGNSIYISNIQNYASTSMYKTVITRGDFGGDRKSTRLNSSH